MIWESEETRFSVICASRLNAALLFTAYCVNPQGRRGEEAGEVVGGGVTGLGGVDAYSLSS